MHILLIAIVFKKEIWTFMTGFIIYGAGITLDVIIVYNVGRLGSKA